MAKPTSSRRTQRAGAAATALHNSILIKALGVQAYINACALTQSRTGRHCFQR